MKKIWNVLSTALVTFQGHWGTSSRYAAYNGNGGEVQGYITQQDQVTVVVNGVSVEDMEAQQLSAGQENQEDPESLEPTEEPSQGDQAPQQPQQEQAEDPEEDQPQEQQPEDDADPE